MYPTCILYVSYMHPYMYPICILICIPYASLCVSYMYPICILYAAYVYPICILYASLYVSYLYPICILYVSHMYPICILICNEYAFHMYSVRHTTACHERSSLGVKRYEITSSRCDGKQQSIAENRSCVLLYVAYKYPITYSIIQTNPDRNQDHYSLFFIHYALFIIHYHDAYYRIRII